MRRHLSLLLTGFVLGIAFYAFVSFNETWHNLEMYLGGLLGVLVCYVIFYFGLFLDKVVPWLKQPGLRLLLGIFLGLLIGYSIVMATVWGYHKVFGHELVNPNQSDLWIKLAILIFCSVLLFNILYFAFYSYEHYVRGQLAALKIERKQAELQLDVLKSQLSPHFLFNCMNSLTELFRIDTSKAEAFIRALAKTYQFNLDRHDSKLITLHEELELLDSYLFLLSTRFGGGFRVQNELSVTAKSSKIPPLTLQILVENAVKHNIVDEHSPIVLKMMENNGKLSVSNNRRPRKDAREGSTKIGLKNIKSRYRLLTEKEIEIEIGQNFTVKLPMIS